MGNDSIEVELRFLQREAGRILGVRLDKSHMDRFRRYMEILQEWNQVFRLVGRDDARTLVRQHLLDSLTLLPFVKGRQRLLDIGSGAGLPGIPLKIARPSLILHMAEARRRRVSFLKEAIRLLDLKETKVFHCRIGTDTRLEGPYGAIVARAVAAPTQWIPWAKDLLDATGVLLLMLGPSADMEEITRKLRTWHLRVKGESSVDLPGTGRRRRIVVVEKIDCFT